MSSYYNKSQSNSVFGSYRHDDARPRYIPRERDDRYDDQRHEPVTHPSICIPRTFPTIRGEQTKRAVFNTFKGLHIGHIERIDTVHKNDKNGERYCTVYIHMKWNMENKLARDTREKLLNGQDIKIVYDEPWFWKCTMSTLEKPETRFSEEHKPRTSTRPRIELGEGTKALSRYTQEKEERYTTNDDQYNPEQLCNMDSQEGNDE
jgi:hypothetical protein